MLSDALVQFDFLGRIIIEPMRRQFILEHAISAADIDSMLEFNPLIPKGREMFFTEGLLAGFYGDTSLSTHYLIPQLEHMVRVLLQRQGLLVSSYDQYGLQKEHNLNGLLYLPALKEILGEDLVFALQCLLVEKFGADFRNKMAHGLMHSGEFFSGSAKYLWWLCLRLCCYPVLAPGTEDSDSAEPDEAEREPEPNPESPPP